MRSRRHSRPGVCRWSIAASSTRSRISAAAPRRAGTGTRTASSRKKPNTFTDFIAAAEHLRADRLCGARQDHRAGRIGRRPADGRHRQHAARSVRRHHRRRAVRRRHEHHARRHAAADAAGMAGVGQSDHRRAGVPHHARLFAVRQRAGAGLSGAACARGTDRSARDLLGAGEVGREAARARHREAICSHSAPTWRQVTAARRDVSTGSRKWRCRMRSRSMSREHRLPDELSDCRADIFAGRRYW